MIKRDIPHLIADGKRVAKRLSYELLRVQYTWAHFEALNGNSPECRQLFRNSLNPLGLGATTKYLLFALFDNTALILYRISDAEGKKKERLTLCKIADLLENDALREELIATARNWTSHLHDLDPEIAEINALTCDRHINTIRGSVVPGWARKPRQADLYGWRNEVRAARDGLLAHLLPMDPIPEVKVHQMRSGLELIRNLIHSSSLVFLGHAPVGDGIKGRIMESTDFWNLAEKGFIAANLNITEGGPRSLPSPDLGGMSEKFSGGGRQ